jgi:hypothetical protein
MRHAIKTTIPAVIVAFMACASCANVDVRFGPDYIDRGLGYWKYGVGGKPMYSVHWLGDSVTVSDGYWNATTYTITASACAGLGEARIKLLREAQLSVAALLDGPPAPPPTEILADAARHRLVYHPQGQLERLELTGFEEITLRPWIESARAMRKVIDGCRDS